MDNEKILSILLRFGLDEAALKRVQAGTLGTKGALDQLEEKSKKAAEAELAALKQMEARAAKTRAELHQLRRVAGELQDVSQKTLLVGGALAGPFVAAANSYVQSVGKSEEISRKWLAATDDIQHSYLRVGRVAAKEILPILEKAADLAEQGARLVEKHPEAVQAALGIGGGLIALGTLGTLAAQGIRLYADVKLIAAAALQDTAADKMLAAAATQEEAVIAARLASIGNGGGGITSVAGKVAGGAGLATAASFAPIAVAGTAFQAMQGFGAARLSETLWSAILGKDTLRKIQQGESDFIGQTLGTGTQNLLNKYLNFMLGTSLTTLQGPVGTARRGGGIGGERSMGGVIRTIPGEAVDAFISFRQAELSAEKDYSERRIALIQKTAQQLTQNELGARDKLKTTQVQEALDFARESRRTEADYYEQRTKKLRDADIEVQREEADHQTQMRQLAEDGHDRVLQLAAQRDALGLTRQLRENEKQRAREEQSYQTDSGRRRADDALSLKDDEEQFKKERALRLDDFERRQREARTQLEESLRDQRQAALRARDQALDDLRDQHTKEKAARAAALHDQLLQINDALTGEYGARAKWYAKMSQDLETWLKGTQNQFKSNLPGWPDAGAGAPGTNPTPSGGYSTTPTGVPPVGYGPPHFAEGGYSGLGGAAILHAREFILNPRTTQAAERLAGGGLTQDRVLAQLASGRSGGSGNSNITVHFHGNYSFSGDLSPSAKAELQSAVENGTLATLAKVVREAKRQR